MLVGSSELEDLQAAGVKVDFFSTHGHKPMGRWPDMRQVYDSMDEWGKYGVKVHVSEATLDVGMPFVSSVKSYEAWTPELVADFFEAYYTTLFSHPDVEAINYWDLGPSLVRGFNRGSSLFGTGQAGLLDPANGDAPRPVYNRLKELITERWMTKFTTDVPRGGAPLTFRGFHGEYEIVVRTAGGKVLKGKFSVEPGKTNTHQLRLVEDGNSVATGR
jgi:hypothetical protein